MGHSQCRKLYSPLCVGALHDIIDAGFSRYQWVNPFVHHVPFKPPTSCWSARVRCVRMRVRVRDRQTHGEKKRWWGFQGRQSVFFLWALERDSCHLQTKPHFLWLSPLKYSICQCHGPGVLPQRVVSRVCWLCHSPIYIRHWQHHRVPNVPSCSTLCSCSLCVCLFSLFAAPAAFLQPLYHCSFLDSTVIFPAEWNEWSPNSLDQSGVWTLSHLVQHWGSFPFQCVSGVSTANITQASNSHACDLTPLVANVSSGEELAWFREDGNFNLPSIIFSIITPFTTISLHRESREGKKRRASCTVCPTLIWVEQKRERGCLYIIRGLL